jgi:hypothetical protein
MIRLMLAAAMVLLIAAPAILIAAKSSLSAPLRLLASLTAFLSPLILIWAIHLVPSLNGEAAGYSALGRSIGILLSVSTLILPWLIYGLVRDRPKP